MLKPGSINGPSGAEAPTVLPTGLRTAAFFFGHQVMHLIDIFVQPAIFMSLYYTLTLPEIKFIDYYISARCPPVCQRTHKQI